MTDREHVESMVRTECDNAVRYMAHAAADLRRAMGEAELVIRDQAGSDTGSSLLYVDCSLDAVAEDLRRARAAIERARIAREQSKKEGR